MTERILRGAPAPAREGVRARSHAAARARARTAGVVTADQNWMPFLAGGGSSEAGAGAEAAGAASSPVALAAVFVPGVAL
jgi:hypothetical protein